MNGYGYLDCWYRRSCDHRAAGDQQEIRRNPQEHIQDRGTPQAYSLYARVFCLCIAWASFVVIPGINPNALGEGSALASQLEGNGLLGLLNVFSGGAFGNAAIFALGVMPYITASIIIQLMGIMIPYFQKMQKEGESGRRKMNQWTRMLTIIVLLIQGPAYITNLYHQVPEAFVYGNTFLFLAYATVDPDRRHHVHHVAGREDHRQGYR